MKASTHPSPTDLRTQRRQRLRADGYLLAVALIWGTAFVVQRIAALQDNVFLFTGLRFLLGALVLLPLASRGIPSAWAALRSDRQLLMGLGMAGCLLFGGAALQQAGLRFTTAGNAGFITGLYVVLIPIILAVGLRRQPRFAVWVSAGLAALGLFLLSTGGQMRFNPGDALVMAGACLWACHVILIGWLVKRLDLLALSISQYLVCGLLSTLVGLLVEAPLLPALLRNGWVVVYTGAFSVGLGYTLQAAGQRVAPPADAAILLSAEAVFAALFGWLILGEHLNPLQLLGCGLIFSGMLLAQLFRDEPG